MKKMCAPLITIILLFISFLSFAAGTPSSYTPYRIVAPCNKATDACAGTYSKQMTTNYQAAMALNRLNNPNDVSVGCYASKDACSRLRSNWNSQVTAGIQQRTLAFDPGARPWLNKKCKTVNLMGVSRIVCTGGV